MDMETPFFKPNQFYEQSITISSVREIFIPKKL